MDAAVKNIRKIMKAIETVLIAVTVCCLITMTVISLVEIVRRYFIGRSFVWSDELIRFSLVWITFLGGSIAYRRGDLVIFDMLQTAVEKKHGKVLLVMRCLVDVISLVFICFIMVKAYEYCLTPSIRLQYSTGLGLSMTYVYGSIPIGFACMFLFSIEKVVLLIRDAMNIKREEAK